MSGNSMRQRAKPGPDGGGAIDPRDRRRLRRTSAASPMDSPGRRRSRRRTPRGARRWCPDAARKFPRPGAIFARGGFTGAGGGRRTGFDARIAPLLHDGAPHCREINCFYEVLSDAAPLHGLLAATASMRGGRPPGAGLELHAGEARIPAPARGRAVPGIRRGAARPCSIAWWRVRRVRYFSDLFRYALLYEHGGLWMDTDVVLLRPFPFRGDYFFNLQWRGGHKGHFICGNVIYAEPHSPHLRNLYEMAVERFFGAGDKEFGDIGPKLLSDYVASDAGAALMDRVFSPMFFNAIDWMEIDRFERPIEQLQDFLNDRAGVRRPPVERAHGGRGRRGANASLHGSLLSDPVAGFPKFTDLADRFDTDKNRHTGNRHCYARVYDRLLAPRRFSLRRLMEIGLCRGLAERNQTTTPSVELWQTYFPFCHVTGVDLTDFSGLNNDRFSSFVCDQSQAGCSCAQWRRTWSRARST